MTRFERAYIFNSWKTCYLWNCKSKLL